MDFFDSQHFSINKKLLKLLGLWPYQKYLDKILIRAVFGLLTVVFSVPQVLSIYVYTGVDVRKVIQAVATFLYIIDVYLKMFMTIVTEDKIQRMYENIAQNWKMVEDEEEIEILLKHSRIGRFFTIAYMFYMFTALIAFITMPMLPLLLDKVAPLNESRPLIFILDGEYLVDPYEHYKKVYVFESLTCILTVIIFSTIDSTYAVCVQQCVALMGVVKIRLDMTKNTIKKLDISERTTREKNAVHNAIVDAVQFHQKAIDFANVVEATYAINFLVVICVTATILSVGAAVVREFPYKEERGCNYYTSLTHCNFRIVYTFLFLIVMNLNYPMEVLRYTMIYIGLILHILYLSWPGQQMIDASGGLLYDAYNNTWYDYSIKTQKILQFMMVRCKDPCQLTAGGIYVMNVANCGTILKTSLSYITVFASMV